MAERAVRIQPPQIFLIQPLVILAQWAFGVWLLPVLRIPPSATPLGWAYTSSLMRRSVSSLPMARTTKVTSPASSAGACFDDCDARRRG